MSVLPGRCVFIISPNELVRAMRKMPFKFIFATLVVFLPVQLVFAHAKLVSSSPPANVKVSPVEVVELRFNERLIAATLKTQLLMTGMPGMARHTPMPISIRSKLSKDGKSVTLLTKKILATGTYEVKWSAAGADTHRMSGEFSFLVE